MTVIGSSLDNVKFKAETDFKLNKVQKYIMQCIKENELNVIMTPIGTGSTSLCRYMASQDLLQCKDEDIVFITRSWDEAIHQSQTINKYLGYIQSKMYISDNNKKVTQYKNNKLICTSSSEMVLGDIVYLHEHLSDFNPRSLLQSHKVVADLSVAPYGEGIYKFFLENRNKLNIIQPKWNNIFETEEELYKYLIEQTHILRYEAAPVLSELFMLPEGLLDVSKDGSDYHKYLLSIDFIESIPLQVFTDYIQYLLELCTITTQHILMILNKIRPVIIL